MGQDNTAIYQKLALSLLELLEDMKLGAMREDHRRLSALVHKLDEEMHARAGSLEAHIDALAKVDKQGDEVLFTRCDNLERRLAVFESEAARLNDQDARIDAIGARVENLWAEHSHKADRDLAVIQGKQVRMGPPPGVPMIRSHVDSWRQSKDAIEGLPMAESIAATAARLRGEPEHAAFSDPTAAAYERIVQERDGYRDGQERMTKARDIALKGCDEANARATILQRELRIAMDLAKSAANQLNDKKTEAAAMRERLESLRDLLEKERGKRMAAEAACTQYRGRVLEIEEQLKRKDALLEDVSQSLQVADADRVPLRMDLDEAKAQIGRMQRCIERVQTWNRGIGTGPGVTEALDDYEQECARAADPDPDKDDCQAGTCDCPTRPGTYDIVHKNDPDPDMPF